MMQFNLPEEIEATKREFRHRWEQKWREQYAVAHKLYHTELSTYGNSRKVLDIDQTPEPPRDLYKDPEFIGFQWDTGFAVFTVDAFAKLSKRKLKFLQQGRR